MSVTEHWFGCLYKPTIQRIMTENRTLAATLADPNATATVENTSFSQVVQLDAKASTTIGNLPGGDIGLAFGAEGRQEKIGLTPDGRPSVATSSAWPTRPSTAAARSTPPSSKLRTPFSKTFEMDFAGRYDKYPDNKSFVPKVGAKWEVSPKASLARHLRPAASAHLR